MLTLPTRLVSLRLEVLLLCPELTSMTLLPQVGPIAYLMAWEKSAVPALYKDFCTVFLPRSPNL